MSLPQVYGSVDKKRWYRPSQLSIQDHSETLYSLKLNKKITFQAKPQIFLRDQLRRKWCFYIIGKSDWSWLLHSYSSSFAMQKLNTLFIESSHWCVGSSCWSFLFPIYSVFTGNRKCLHGNFLQLFSFFFFLNRLLTWQIFIFFWNAFLLLSHSYFN